MHRELLIFLGLLLWSVDGQYQIERRDPLAELSSSLATKQSAACDGDTLHMLCPPNTKISIQLVQYGRLTPQDDLCPANIRYPGPLNSPDNEQEKCLILEAIRTVEERCHSKESCSVTASPDILAHGLRDPCPTVRKYVEVLYKCKPVSFRSRVVCAGERVSLKCSSPEARLAIFSATFSTTGGGHVFCPVTRHVAKSRVTDISCDYPVTSEVSQLCHGYSDCQFLADSARIGGVPHCVGAAHLTLKVTYACVDQSVFNANYVDRVTTTSTTTTTTTTTTSSTSSTAPFVPLSVTTKSVISPDGILKSQESKEFVVDVVSDDILVETKDDRTAMLETNSNSFEEEHKSKLLVFTALLATICFMSSLLAILVKACHRSRSRTMIPAAGQDLDTVSSDLDLSVDLQLHEMTSAATSCQTLLPPASSSTKVEFKPKGILKNSKTSENFRLYQNPVDNSVKCSSMGQYQTLERSNPIKNMMDESFLVVSQSDIEDQSECGVSQFSSSAGLTPDHHRSNTLNPNFDKKLLLELQSSQPQQQPQLSSSQITTELIEQLLRLRAAAASVPSPQASHQRGYHQSETHINSCVNDGDNSQHANEHAGTQSVAPPQAQCLQTLDNSACEDDKLFVL